MRLGPNELIFSEIFLNEHKQIIARLSSVTGMAIERINRMVRKKIQSENNRNRMNPGAPMMRVPLPNQSMVEESKEV